MLHQNENKDKIKQRILASILKYDYIYYIICALIFIKVIIIIVPQNIKGHGDSSQKLWEKIKIDVIYNSWVCLYMADNVSSKAP